MVSSCPGAQQLQHEEEEGGILEHPSRLLFPPSLIRQTTTTLSCERQTSFLPHQEETEAQESDGEVQNRGGSSSAEAAQHSAHFLPLEGCSKGKAKQSFADRLYPDGDSPVMGPLLQPSSSDAVLQVTTQCLQHPKNFLVCSAAVRTVSCHTGRNPPSLRGPSVVLGGRGEGSRPLGAVVPRKSPTRAGWGCHGVRAMLGTMALFVHGTAYHILPGAASPLPFSDPGSAPPSCTNPNTPHYAGRWGPKYASSTAAVNPSPLCRCPIFYPEGKPRQSPTQDPAAPSTRPSKLCLTVALSPTLVPWDTSGTPFFPHYAAHSPGAARSRSVLSAHSSIPLPRPPHPAFQSHPDRGSCLRCRRR